MKWLNGLVAAFLLSASVAMMSSAGCQEETASRHDKPAPLTNEPTPEESFALVFETFRRGVETGAGGVPGGFIASDDDGHSRLTVNNQVTHELVPPAKADEPYRASITVVSVATYSMARGLGEEDDDETAEESQKQSGSGLSATPAGDDANVLDPALISTSNNQDVDSSQAKLQPVARRDDRETRTFDLVYENGRWRLTDESQKQLDPETEQAIINAFDNALKRQV